MVLDKASEERWSSQFKGLTWSEEVWVCKGWAGLSIGLVSSSLGWAAGSIFAVNMTSILKEK